MLQLHDIFAVTKTGIQYTINISPTDQLVKQDVLEGHNEGVQIIPGFEMRKEKQDGEPVYPPILNNHHGNYDRDPLNIMNRKTLKDMIVACRYY